MSLLVCRVMCFSACCIALIVVLTACDCCMLLIQLGLLEKRLPEDIDLVESLLETMQTTGI